MFRAHGGTVLAGRVGYAVSCVFVSFRVAAGGPVKANAPYGIPRVK